ncbi:glycosyltransferase family A protein [Nostoc sp. FACHB-888]|uniref:glycosyltransferase family A protein n=1 Tax=Nostoc sp. FACHB-888 TaxID=2692842 RepID=UPI001685342A|nr:glycosyltransferase family A protein [Nostoc sp. FACHB-888]MBD2248421.1 glycosyltransferase [Nostoc sp. FACHB-888]
MDADNQKSILPDEKYMYTFTIFTPTYNRASTISRVYESLKHQTFQDFEWLIIDDGSTDNTSSLVRKWQEDAKFTIRYIFQENSGKHVAYNKAARLAKGKFLVNLDSDDACIPVALERFKYHWDAIPEDEQSSFSGVDCLCQDPQGNLIGDLYPFSPLDSNYSEVHYRYKVTGEKWGFQLTTVFQEFPFPEPSINPTPCIPESIVWSNLTQKYKARYINECLRIYYINGGPSQLTKTSSASKNPTGLNLVCKNMLDVEIRYFIFSPFAFLKAAINYSRSSFHLQKNLGQQLINLQSWEAKFLWLICFPVGYVFWLRDSLNKR